MGGLGWQELVIILIILAVIAIPLAILIVGVRSALDNRRRVESGQVSGQEYAGFWLRAAAELADGLILLIPSRIVGRIADGLQPGQTGQLGGGVAGWIIALVYTVILNGRGATLGKRWARIRVIDDAGNPPGLARASVRAAIPFGLRLLLLIASLRIAVVQEQNGPAISTGAAAATALFLVLMLIDYLWMIWDPRKQTLHDKLAGTFVTLDAQIHSPVATAVDPF